YVHLGSSTELGSVLKAVKEQVRAVPQHGIGYGLLRYVCQDQEVQQQVQTVPQPQIGLNYLGQSDQAAASFSELFAAAAESSGTPSSPLAERPHLLDVLGQISGGQLQLSWSFSRQIYRPQTIRQVASAVMGALRALIAHCQLPEARGYTPSDFPLAGLSQQELDAVLGTDRLVEALYPLSPLQQGMLYHTLASPQEGAYVIQVACALEGRLDPERFKQAWQQVMQRHAVLRSQLLWQGVQRAQLLVRTSCPVSIPIHDWRELSQEQQELQREQYLQQDRQRGFDLSHAPLMRLALWRLSQQHTVLLWSFHHVLLDGWSLPIVLGEVLSTYQALCTNQALPSQPVRPYQDYIAWLAQQSEADAQAYWRRELAGVSEPTPLGIDRAISQVSEPVRYEEAQFVWSQAETAALQEFSRQQQVTLNTLLVAAWALLLSHYSGQDDVVFGTVVSGRPAQLLGVESMVGLFINTLPLRVRIARHESLQAWLLKLQQQQAELRQYEYSPLVQVQGCSEVPRGTPLFESLFAFENYPLQSQSNLQEENSGLRILDMQSQEQTTYPLTLAVLPGTQLALKILYNQARFERGTITRLVHHLRTVLKSFLTQEQRPLPLLSYMSPLECQQLVDEWNETGMRYEQQEDVLTQFEQQVRLVPDAIALNTQEGLLSYQDLDHRATHLAHCLREQGGGPETVVGLCLERGALLVVSLLACMKAGAAYLPLDPVGPAERLLFMLQDSQARLL